MFISDKPSLIFLKSQICAVGIRSDTRIGEKTTLRELLQRYLDEIVPSAGNPKREGNRIKALMRRDIASFFVAAIRPVDIGNFIAEREAEGVGGNTIRLDVAALSKLFNLARTSWGFDSIGNPTEKVRRPKVARGRERRLNGDEEQRLLDAASEKLRPVIQFALETAMRREEIASLKWSDVDFERHVARLQHTKNGEPRTVPLSPAAYRLLLDTRNERGSDDSTIFGISADAITQAMEAARNKAGIEDLHFHDLRHEATSRLFENTDLDTMEIKAITGHKSMQMLARYTHLRTDRLVKRLEAAAEASNPKPEETEETPYPYYIIKPANPAPSGNRLKRHHPRGKK